ncbi:MAG: hypothetical protein ABIN00_08160 [candidate division WOR-3 bacterium]
MKNIYKLISGRAKRLNKVAKELKREKIWTEELMNVFLENTTDDLRVFSYLLSKK